ncbi:MAG: hypothetical protein OXF11_08360 [Deltaproteobacteria bacterium]|nr:hypothetical protein [Deltaproteobacteria bacterium]
MKTPSALAVALFVWLVGCVSGAAEMPAGPVVLTVAGDIVAANRPAYDEQRDMFLKHHKRTFDKAFVFDRPMLERLGVREVRADTDWAGPRTASGPLLVDVLNAAGCRGGTFDVLALDGFRFKLSKEDVEAREWVVATRADGRPLGIGDRGPLWLVFDPAGDRPATAKEIGLGPWALFFIECG